MFKIRINVFFILLYDFCFIFTIFEQQKFLTSSNSNETMRRLLRASRLSFPSRLSLSPSRHAPMRFPPGLPDVRSSNSNETMRRLLRASRLSFPSRLSLSPSRHAHFRQSGLVRVGRKGRAQNNNYAYRQTLPACAHSYNFVLCLREQNPRISCIESRMNVIRNGKDKKIV